jgi:hypothetical protein
MVARVLAALRAGSDIDGRYRVVMSLLSFGVLANVDTATTDTPTHLSTAYSFPEPPQGVLLSNQGRCLTLPFCSTTVSTVIMSPARQFGYPEQVSML